MTGLKPSAVTIGVFDGVHRGHASLALRTVEEARRLSGDAVAFTFDPHPATVLAPGGAAPPLLTTVAERREFLLDLGLARVHVLHFDRAMSDLTPEDFIEFHLLARESMRHLVIGHDFALGRGRAGTAARLAAIGRDRGFEVTRVPALLDNGTVISSSRIRAAILAAEFDQARALLGRPYQVRGVVMAGEARGRAIGFPTANLPVPAGRYLPPFGVYAVRVYQTVPPAGHPLPGVMNYGVRPTFGGGSPSLEVHVIGFEGDLLGKPLAAEFVGRIRGEMKFPGVEALREQIARDVESALRLLGAGP